MIARFVSEIVQLQQKCRDEIASDLGDDRPLDMATERKERFASAHREYVAISNLWRDSVIMDSEVSPGMCAMSPAKLIDDDLASQCPHVSRRSWPALLYREVFNSRTTRRSSSRLADGMGERFAQAAGILVITTLVSHIDVPFHVVFCACCH